MAFRVKRTVDTTTSIPTGIPSFTRISQMVKKLINASQYDYHESEAFEVREVNLNASYKGYGAVTGTFINNPTQEILGGVVLPLMPNITNIPVIGEHVVVTEYNGQHYYTSIVNRKNSPNENAIPGASGTYEKDTKYGDTFERKDIRRVEVNEGDIVYEGRFGNSIKLGSDPTNGSPVIKIRAGQTLDTETRDIFQKPVKESIDNDASSIYLISDGLVGETFEEEQISGKKILIKSDGIFISGRDNIRLKALNSISLNSDVINLGSEANESVVKGEELKKIIDMLLDSAIGAKTTEIATKLAISGGVPTPETIQLTSETAELQAIKDLPATPYLSTKVKTS
jgi:hypothetical protein